MSGFATAGPGVNLCPFRPHCLICATEITAGLGCYGCVINWQQGLPLLSPVTQPGKPAGRGNPDPASDESTLWRRNLSSVLLKHSGF